MADVDVIGGFPDVDPNCKGCGQPLMEENAWMTDGCPCNLTLGINSMNETRWRLLMRLQQRQSYALSMIREKLGSIMETEGCDAGVILLSQDGPTHFDAEVNCQVYDHEYFSPLGDALMEIYGLACDGKNAAGRDTGTGGGT